VREVTDSLTIVTDPPGASVRLIRFANGRASDTIDAGLTPLNASPSHAAITSPTSSVPSAHASGD
jgi:hypothetical protein